MKKVLCIILCLLLFLTFCGCSSDTDEDTKDKRMDIIYTDTTVIIYRDNETGVQYIRTGNGGICVMVNEDGTPYIGKDKCK